MASATFSMDLSALERITEKLTDAVKNRRELLMEAVGEAMVSSTIERFDKGVDPEGRAWEPSARAWIEGLSSGTFGKTLARSGRLKGSLVYEASRDAVLWGSNVEYAAIHQFGGMAGRGRKVRIPQRAYIGVSDEDKEEIRFLMRRFLQDGGGL